MSNKNKLPRSVWLPFALLIYLGIMTAFFAPDLIEGGETIRLVTVCAIELILIILLHILLKKKESGN